jgi:hypothetical protein
MHQYVFSMSFMNCSNFGISNNDFGHICVKLCFSRHHFISNLSRYMGHLCPGTRSFPACMQFYQIDDLSFSLNLSNIRCSNFFCSYLFIVDRENGAMEDGLLPCQRSLRRRQLEDRHFHSHSHDYFLPKQLENHIYFFSHGFN